MHHALSRTMADPAEIAVFTLAGHATLTLKSLASGSHYTYRVSKSDDGRLWFVSVLVDGGDGTYAYLGIIRPESNGPLFRTTAKSSFKDDSPACRAFRYFFQAVVLHHTVPAQLEVRHEGHCGRCGRELTHPDSIDRGIGPDCAGHLGIAA